jgi:peroxiredoxin
MRIAVLAGCLALACAALAQETFRQQPKSAESKPKPATATAAAAATTASRAEQLQALRKAYDGAAEKLQEELDEAEAKYKELVGKQAEQAQEQIGKLLKLVKADPKDGVALEAIEHLLQEQIEFLDKDQAAAIFETLAQHHAANDKIAPICALAAELELSDAMRAFLSAVVAKNKNVEARAWAQFALATAKYMEGDAANDVKRLQEAELLFQQVVAAVPAEAAEGTPVDAAQRYLFELRNLLPGMRAPDFETADLAGKTVKLSQQRGKVTLLVFWATWCEFCAELQPQQLELLKKHSGRPFSIVAVSGDDEADTVKQHLATHPLPWTHWFNGPDGGVLDTWNVQAFPTVYVIDAAGVIRHRNIRGDELNKAVEALVKEAEALAKEATGDAKEDAAKEAAAKEAEAKKLDGEKVDSNKEGDP